MPLRTVLASVATLAAAGLLGSSTPGPNTALDFHHSVVRIPDALVLNPPGTWTVEAWIRPRTVDAAAVQTILGKYAGPDSVAYTLELRGPVLRLRISNGARTQSVLSFPDIRAGDWQHVAVTYQQRTVRLYVNGALETAVGGIVPPRRSSGPLLIGNAPGADTTRGFDGAIDEIRFWALARTSRDINATMRRILTGREPWLVGYWRCDDGSGDTLHDASRNADHGQLGAAAGPDPADPRWTTDAAPVR